MEGAAFAMEGDDGSATRVVSEDISDTARRRNGKEDFKTNDAEDNPHPALFSLVSPLASRTSTNTQRRS